MSKVINEEAFSALCYLVLMDHHGDGFVEAHPSYMEEKRSLLDNGYEAYGALDRLNQLEVKQHILRWGYSLPEKIADYEKRTN